MRTVWVSFDTIGRDCLDAAAEAGAEVVGVVTLPGPVDPNRSGQCSFDVFRHVLENRSILTTFSDGSQLTTGTFKERLTNVSTGKFIDVNASGPILAVFHADGSSTESSRGRQFVRPFGKLLITTGNLVVDRDPAGVIVGFSQQGGTSEDVCELLA